MNENYTKLPSTIKKIMKHHAYSVFKISEWLKSLGCKLSWYYEGLEKLERRTRINIQIEHTDDYIDCGRGYDNPDGKMFDITTTEEIEINFPVHLLRSIVMSLEKLSDHKIKVEGLENVYLSFFDWERKLEANWYQVSKAADLTDDDPVLKMILKFDIYHKKN